MNNDEAVAEGRTDVLAALAQHTGETEALETANTPQAPESAPSTTDAPDQTPEQPETPANPTPVAEGAEAPETETEVASDTNDEEIDWTQFLPQPTNVEAPQPDENGQVDFEQLMDYKLNQKLAAQSAELRGWQQATRVLPEIAKDPQLRDFVHNQRLASVATGGSGDLAEAAKTVKAILGRATAEGKAQATASVTVQQAAALEKPTPTQASDTTKTFNPDDPAQVQGLLADWIDQGAI